MFFPSASDLDPIMGGILANLNLHRGFQVNEDWLNHENRKRETCSQKLRCLGESALPLSEERDKSVGLTDKKCHPWLHLEIGKAKCRLALLPKQNLSIPQF